MDWGGHGMRCSTGAASRLCSVNKRRQCVDSRDASDHSGTHGTVPFVSHARHHEFSTAISDILSLIRVCGPHTNMVSISPVAARHTQKVPSLRASRWYGWCTENLLVPTRLCSSGRPFGFPRGVDESIRACHERQPPPWKPPDGCTHSCRDHAGCMSFSSEVAYPLIAYGFCSDVAQPTAQLLRTHAWSQPNAMPYRMRCQGADDLRNA